MWLVLSTALLRATSLSALQLHVYMHGYLGHQFVFYTFRLGADYDDNSTSDFSEFAGTVSV